MTVADDTFAHTHGAQPGAPIHVVATTAPGTRGALAAALALAEDDDSRVYVMARTPMSAGTASVDGARAAQAEARAIRELPGASSPRVTVLAVVGDRPADLMPLLPRGSVVLVGGPSRRWWPTSEQRIAATLERLGCRVIFVHA
jgi:hypothetical protein